MKRILARMKEISECVRNFGVNADQLGKMLREFAMAGNPVNTPDGKPSETVVREPRTYEQMVGTEVDGAVTLPEVQPGANVTIPTNNEE